MSDKGEKLRDEIRLLFDQIERLELLRKEVKSMRTEVPSDAYFDANAVVGAFDDLLRTLRQKVEDLKPSEDLVMDELRNLAAQPGVSLFPGSVLNHAAMDECVRRRWAVQGDMFNFILTRLGEDLKS